MYERADPGVRSCAEHTCRAVHVRVPQEATVASGLDQPGEVDDRVRAAEKRDEVGARDVRLRPLGLRELELGSSSGDADDGLDGGLVGKSLEEAGADVPGCSRDHDAHTG